MVKISEIAGYYKSGIIGVANYITTEGATTPKQVPIVRGGMSAVIVDPLYMGQFVTIYYIQKWVQYGTLRDPTLYWFKILQLATYGYTLRPIL